MKKHPTQKNKGGYTIIETMIAISLFLVIVTAGMGAVLNANLLNQKSQSMRSILDNLSFVMEDMSRNLRTGHSYHCIDDGILTLTNPHSCNLSGVGGGISFKSVDGSQWVYAIFSDGTIQRSTSGGTIGTFKLLNAPPDVFVDSTSSFSVTGAEPPNPDGSGDHQQPFVTIRLVGHVDYKGTSIPFSLQTSVSQRNIDI